MTKTELLSTYTAEQLAEIVVELQNENKKQSGEIWEQVCKRTGLEIYLISQINFMERIEEIVSDSFEKMEEMAKKQEDSEFKELVQKKCKEHKGENLKSEVEKYCKAFEDAKKERDCQIAEHLLVYYNNQKESVNEW